MRLKNREILPGCYYRHFKGNIYQVIGVAIHTETEEEMVVYRAQYGEQGLFVRPYSMFAEEVDQLIRCLRKKLIIKSIRRPLRNIDLS